MAFAFPGLADARSALAATRYPRTRRNKPADLRVPSSRGLLKHHTNNMHRDDAVQTCGKRAVRRRRCDSRGTEPVLFIRTTKQNGFDFEMLLPPIRTSVPRMPTPPSLQELSFQSLLANVGSLTSAHVSSLPEHVQLTLFDGVLAKGALNENVLRVFQQAARTCAPLFARIESLNLKPLPPRPTATRARWLGDNPSWY